MKHYDAALHTRGESQYINDMPRPDGMLHGAIFSSPIAHGHLQGLDIDAALAIEGVKAVITARDIPGENQIGPLIQDEALLAESEVHFIGHPIAVVVADRPEIARKAAAAIIADIDPLPVVTDPREAYAAGQLIGPERTFEMGDIKQAWQDCDVIVEGRTDIGGQEHVYLETQAARAIPEEEGRIKIYSSTQSPYAVQKAAAKILAVPNHKVEVDVKRIGGGFGGKEDQATQWGCMAALAARVTGKAVEIVLNRHDDLKMTGKRHPYTADFKMGLSAKGKILAYQVMHYQNGGASADLSPAVMERTLFHSTNAYYVPNARITAASCRTNIPPNTAFRGFGGPQGMFVIEAAIARAAEALKMSCEEIQRKNLIRPDEMFPYGQKAENARAVKTWKAAEKAYDIAMIRKKITAHNKTNSASKRGFAVMPICFGISFTATFLNQGSALVHVYTDGSVSITTGGVEMGQGINSKIINMAAKALGISESRIRVESTNTTRIANMSPSAASATTDLCGNATLIAIDKILGRLSELAANQLNLKKASKISIVDEQVTYKGKPTDWNWEKLVATAYFSRIGLSAHGFYATPNVHFDKAKEKGRPFNYHVYGTAIFEVTVDCLRGTYRIDAAKLVHDLGRPINRIVDIGQVEGGLAQGLGWMTMEDLQYDEQGRLLSGALASYKVPEVYFMPENLQIEFLEDKNPNAPYGSKAVGEPPLLYGIGVFYAIRNALRAFRPKKPLAFHAPMTPERVLMALYDDTLAEIPAKISTSNGTVEKVEA